jgi:hypothetical protein
MHHCEQLDKLRSCHLNLFCPDLYIEHYHTVTTLVAVLYVPGTLPFPVNASSTDSDVINHLDYVKKNKQ